MATLQPSKDRKDLLQLKTRLENEIRKMRRLGGKTVSAKKVVEILEIIRDPDSPYEEEQ